MPDSVNSSSLSSNNVSVVVYDIAGNVLRAFYGAGHRLLFVLDETVSAYKPNALLVMNPVAGRKWDDVLVADFGVDLERVRPKKDNKYQKLDIEYSGLDNYDNLIAEYESGHDVSDALRQLDAFRNNVVRRMAVMRLDNATGVANRARETIDKTNETIVSLQNQLKQLRTKVTDARKLMGKEPAKQSAAKILRAEARVESANDKIVRTQKRLANAQRRLAAAKNDANAAREILNIIDNLTDDAHKVNNVAEAASYSVISNAPEIITEPKAEKMAEEVKPLFDKDPEILDENIAFKPIDFDVKADEDVKRPVDDVAADSVTPVFAPVVQEDIVVHQTDDRPVADMMRDSDVTPPQPLQFTPPYSASDDFGPIADVPSMQSVLESMRSINGDNGEYTDDNSDNQEVKESDDNTYVDVKSDDVYDEPYRPIAVEPSVNMDYDKDSVVMAEETYRPQPVNNSVGVAAPLVRPSAPVSDVSDASNNSGFRPVSPIDGSRMANPVPQDDAPRSKVLYYFLLVFLIVLSIFALWQYQKSTIENMPELGTVAGNVVATESSQDTNDDSSPFFKFGDNNKVSPDVISEQPQQTETTVVEEVNTPVEVPEVEEPTVTESVELVEQQIDSDVVEESIEEVPVQPIQNSDNNASVQTETNGSELAVDIYANPKIDTETSVVSDGVLGDTDNVVEPLPSTDTMDNDIEDTSEVPVESPFVSDEVVQKENVQILSLVNKPEYNVSQHEKMFVADAEYETEQPDVGIQNTETVYNNSMLCLDGSMPDRNGCCTGEVFTDMENGTFACCQPVPDGECYAPMK